MKNFDEYIGMYSRDLSRLCLSLCTSPQDAEVNTLRNSPVKPKAALTQRVAFFRINHL